MHWTGNLTTWVAERALNTPKQKLVGENLMMSEIFELICEQHSIRYDMVLLLTDSGLIISSSLMSRKEDLLGHTISISAFENCSEEFIHISSRMGYHIISSSHIGAQHILQNISALLESILKTFGRAQLHNAYIFKAFDYITSAISIFDIDANLIYTNKSFCSLFHIDDRSKVLGMNINDIMKTYGITISSRNTNKTHLKMFDVLKTGKEELGWEIVLESKFLPHPIQLVENDLFPIFDDDGKVSGVLDIFHSHIQDFQRSKKFIALSANYTFNDIVCKSETMQDVINLAKRMSRSANTILVTGESGVGKELFVQSIHNYSDRRNNPFVALNCASFPSELITSELFGYEPGAFTDASKKGHIGKFELANGGTLFLDEISELPYDSQSKLLRILETWLITRIGSTNEIPVDVRLIAASNKDLQQMVAAGLFREDLYYRLQTLTLRIPPLRQRRSDIIPLSKFFLQQCAHQNSCKPKKLRSDAIGLLQSYNWPGNVRELKNVMTSITILSKDDEITADILSNYIHSGGNNSMDIHDGTAEERIDVIKQEISQGYIKLLNEALIITGGNRGKAADLLGISRRTFYRMMDKYIK